MNLFNTNQPTYKSVPSLAATPVAHAQPAPASGLSGVIGSLFGNATPAYKTADGGSATVAASSEALGCLLSAGTPSYKTVGPEARTLESAVDLSEARILVDSEIDEVVCGCPPQSDEVVLL